ncbi:MAG: class I SAM-dependent methyltransferase [Thermoleophilia bacterium]
MHTTGPDWNARYAGEAYAFGTEPNTFLTGSADVLPRGRALSLGEGEGRNAVWLARNGFRVWSVDGSAVGVAKTQRLAAGAGVTVHARRGRLEGVEISPGSWEVITSIFCHLHPDLRGPLHRAVVRGLAPGGVFALEAYTPGQLTRGTGGPSDPAMLPTLEILRHELEGLEFMHARELERDVVEGHLHTGAACVVQVLARRP